MDTVKNANTSKHEEEEHGADDRDSPEFQHAADDQQTPPTEDRLRYTWIDGRPAAENYREFGALLAECGDVFRDGEAGEGLLVLTADKSAKPIKAAKEYMPIIVDRVDVSIYLDGKSKGGMLSTSHLNTMLRSEEYRC